MIRVRVRHLEGLLGKLGRVACLDRVEVRVRVRVGVGVRARIGV